MEPRENHSSGDKDAKGHSAAQEEPPPASTSPDQQQQQQLRQIRKKRLLESLNEASNTSATPIVVQVKSEPLTTTTTTTTTPGPAGDSEQPAPKVCRKEIKSALLKAKEEAKRQASSEEYEVSENNTLTLQQFTDIVLATEDVKREATAAAAEGANGELKAVPLMLERRERQATCSSLASSVEENNNKSASSPKSPKKEDSGGGGGGGGEDGAAETKPLRAQPVILSPRQPPGSLFHNHHLSHHGRHGRHVGRGGRGAASGHPPQQTPLSSSVVVSVKPRVLSTSCAAGGASSGACRPALPPNKPPNIPRLVEEWFQKMQPPPSEQPRFPPLGQRSASTEALNLSTKMPSRLTKMPSFISTAGGKTTQIYLSPIQKEHPITKTKVYLHQTPQSVVPSNRLSPPRLEIKRVEPAPLPQSPLIKKQPPTVLIGEAVPFESGPGLIHLETIRARAFRDVKMAHSKDMHGNYPIHVGVLMRKADLVRRYCCILQVLESAIDLYNDDKMTPLHLAIRDCSLEIIDILLAFGADPAVQDRRGNSSIHLATDSKNADVLRMLVKHVRRKEDVNKLNECGYTPLHIATMNGDTTSAEILTKAGADPTIPDGLHGLTALAMAQQAKTDTKGPIANHIPKKANSQVEIPSR